MARTIDEIKDEMQRQFMSNDALMARYGIEPGGAFDAHFGRLSIEGLLLYIVAVAIWAHERIFDQHQEEVQELIARQKPHTPRWYAEKARAFRFGQGLVDGTDGYDDTGLREADIEAMRVVKSAAATEHGTTLHLKVATLIDDRLHPLSPAQLESFTDYMNELKDAGLHLDIASLPGDGIRLTAIVLYDPQVLDGDGRRLDTAELAPLTAIARCVENIPFDGGLSRMALVDALQSVEGVRVAEITSCETRGADGAWRTMEVMAVPQSGYYQFDPVLMNIAYIPYDEYVRAI